MKFQSPRFAASVAALAALAMAGAADATITYTVDETIGGGSVVGTIVTDGATGVLGAADILSWNLVLMGVGAPAPTYDLSSATAGTSAFVSGDALTATTKGLFFDFSGSAGDYFLLQHNPFSGQTYYCDEATGGGGSPCIDGASDIPEFYGAPSGQIDSTLSGKVEIGVAAGVPEPSIWAMMLIGFGGLGAAVRSRRRGVLAA